MGDMKRLIPIKPAPTLLAALALLGGCSMISPEARVHEKLLAAGVKPHLADCLAPKLAHKLSISELDQLGKAAKLAKAADRTDGDHPHHIGIGELADRLQAVNDPHIIDVVTRAGLSCAIGG